ncbi:MAG TPA: TraR/DksA C4-type zinc finger protein [Candidatus Methylomirabilis sp.]|nr:TraR/DksA C4-type zinc finger protein [Candidatus Methylomirabilis sp.]
MLTPEFIAVQHTKLEEEKSRLERDLGDIGRKDPKRPNHYDAIYPESGSNSDDDNAMEIAEFSDDLSLEAKLETELRDTNKALEAIQKGKYGICKYCNKEIDLKRLEARPTSSSCIQCKKALTQEV